MTLKAGDTAPHFVLRDQHRQEVSLTDLKGSKSLIVFIPFPFTGTCEAELCDVRDNLSSLNSAETKVVAITTSTVPVHKKWAEENGFEFPILSDFWPHGVVSEAYGVFNDKLGCAMRSTFVLDEDGIIQSVVAVDSLAEKRDFAEYTAALGMSSR